VALWACARQCAGSHCRPAGTLMPVIGGAVRWGWGSACDLEFYPSCTGRDEARSADAQAYQWCVPLCLRQRLVVSLWHSCPRRAHQGPLSLAPGLQRVAAAPSHVTRASAAVPIPAENEVQEYSQLLMGFGEAPYCRCHTLL
jgi:hypothetical protein